MTEEEIADVFDRVAQDLEFPGIQNVISRAEGRGRRLRARRMAFLAGGSALAVIAIVAAGVAVPRLAGTSHVTSSAGASASAAPTASPSPEPTASANGCDNAAEEEQEKQAIAADWAEFFNGNAPYSERIALLQDGSEFSAILQAQGASTLAEEASAQVTSVSLTSCTLASVSYTILLDGVPALPSQHGQAVNTNGTWQVSDVSFCALLFLENGGSSAGLPAVCSAAGS